MIINNKLRIITIASFAIIVYQCSIPTNVTTNNIDKPIPKNDSITIKENSKLTNKLTKDEYVDEKQVWRDVIYNESIETVMLYNSSDELSDPVYELNSSETLTLRFDELSTDISDFHYSIFRCKKDWTDSDLNEMDYLNGFQDNPIENYKNSYGTYVPYVNYSLTIPNDNVKLLKSGNYRIVVYHNGESESPVFSKNFFVTENNIGVYPDMKQTASIETHDYQQEIDVDITYDGISIIDPFKNIELVIEQNRMPNFSCNSLSPNFVREEKITYNREDCNIFWGANEFHPLDLTAIRQNPDFESNRGDMYNNSITIRIDPKRTYKKYLEQPDIDGKYKIRTISGLEKDNHVDADYLYVSFKLDLPYDREHEYYIIGGMTNWGIYNRYLMTYDDEEQLYKCKVLLKQGYYNYLYAAVNNSTQEVSLSEVEGAHYITQNTYLIKVYYSDPQKFYDRLLAYRVFNSRKI